MNNEENNKKDIKITDIVRGLVEIEDNSLLKERGLIEVLKFYKEKEIEITFRLKTHQEYFISGIVKKIQTQRINKGLFLVELELKNKEKAIFCSWNIDSETIIPSSYNPIRYFNRTTISEELRKKIFDRDNNECQIRLDGCTKNAEEIDHIIPVSKGGLNYESNLQASCSNCNKKKNNNIIF